MQEDVWGVLVRWARPSPVAMLGMHDCMVMVHEMIAVTSVMALQAALGTSS